MTSHELAKELLELDDIDVQASIDISTGDDDADRRIFTNECFGVQNDSWCGMISILFGAMPVDNKNKVL